MAEGMTAQQMPVPAMNPMSVAVQALAPGVAAEVKTLKAAGDMVVGGQITLWADAQGEPMVSSHLKVKGLCPFFRRGNFVPGSAVHAHMCEIAHWVNVPACKVARSAFLDTHLDWAAMAAAVA